MTITPLVHTSFRVYTLTSAPATGTFPIFGNLPLSLISIHGEGHGQLPGVPITWDIAAEVLVL